MVINIGAAKDGKWDLVESDIAAVNAVKDGRILKVIIETSLLTDEEKSKLVKQHNVQAQILLKHQQDFQQLVPKLKM